MSPLQIAAIYIAANILILIWLSFRVVAWRRKTRGVANDAIPDGLARAIRVHGNASEYIPAAMLGLLVIASAGANRTGLGGACAWSGVYAWPRDACDWIFPNDPDLAAAWHSADLGRDAGCGDHAAASGALIRRNGPSTRLYC